MFTLKVKKEKNITDRMRCHLVERKTFTWTTSSKEVIFIKDLKSSHIGNILIMYEDNCFDEMQAPVYIINIIKTEVLFRRLSGFTKNKKKE